jgi:membrane-bound lytic murein transglycosylase B
MRWLPAALALYAATAVAAPTPYQQRQEVKQFIAEMVERHGFARRELVSLFSRVRFEPAIVKAMTPPPESPERSWQTFRALFLNPQRIEAGVQFRTQHAATLARAAAEFGVPVEIVVAIIGVETGYGRNMGAYRVIDALATLAFDFPPRARFFRGELENYLLFTRESGMDVFILKGSYAGAIGIPQFMPGTYRRFAIDYDGDGIANLAASAADAIGSVANFLSRHGWERGEPVAYAAEVTGENWRSLAAAGFSPKYRIGDLPAFGVKLAESPPADKACALIELETPGQPSEYRVGLRNFHVLTRYNRSGLYAAAVLDLATAIAREGREIRKENP